MRPLVEVAWPPNSLTLQADTGIPMIVLTWPGMLLLLIPIIVLEGLLCRKWLGWSTRDALRLNAASNVVSTLVGVPIAWGVMLLLQLGAVALLISTGVAERWTNPGPLAQAIFFLFASAWVETPENGSIGVIPAATLVLLVPFFFASYWIEYVVMKRMLGWKDGDQPDFELGRIKIAVRNANLVCYAAMFVATATWLIFELARRTKS